MSCHYDDAIFQNYRAKAVTDYKQLELGKRYWSNSSYPETFVLKGLIFANDLINID